MYFLVSQKMNLLLHEVTFFRVYPQTSCSDSCQHLPQGLQHSLKGVAVHQNVIKIYQALLMWHLSQHLVHQPCKGGQSIAQPKTENVELSQARYVLKTVLWLDSGASGTW